jgi:GNAT superfamily N-acetyltransferase
VTLGFSDFNWRTELAEQRALFSDCFPENAGLPPESEAFYERKFHALSESPPSYEFVARDENGLAGYYAALPFRYPVAGEALSAGMVCDVMTSPRLRGKGVFARLGAFALGRLRDEGVDFVTGYPRRPEVIPGHLKVGWEIAFKLPMYLLPIRSKELIRPLQLSFMSPGVDAGLKLWDWMLGTLSPVDSSLTTETVSVAAFFSTFDYQAFFERWKAGKQHVLEKSEAFLSWRLSIRQEADYRVIAVRRDRLLVGIAIVGSCEPDGVRSLCVLDLMAIEDERIVLRSLRNELRRLAVERQLSTVIMMMSEYHARRLRLWRYGFLRTPIVFSLILKRLSERARVLVSSAPEHWHLMWIDSDDL